MKLLRWLRNHWSTFLRMPETVHSVQFMFVSLGRKVGSGHDHSSSLRLLPLPELTAFQDHAMRLINAFAGKLKGNVETWEPGSRNFTVWDAVAYTSRSGHAWVTDEEARQIIKLRRFRCKANDATLDSFWACGWRKCCT